MVVNRAIRKRYNTDVYGRLHEWIQRARRKQISENAAEPQVTQYRRLAGTMLWIGKVFCQQNRTQLQHSWRYDTLSKQTRWSEKSKKLEPVFLFRQADKCAQVMPISFSDTSFNISTLTLYDKDGVISGIRTAMEDGSEQFYVIYWMSTKQKRISHSSYGTEILACVGDYPKIVLRSQFPNERIPNEISIDSMGLYDIIQTLHEGNKCRLRQKRPDDTR